MGTSLICFLSSLIEMQETPVKRTTGTTFPALDCSIQRRVLSWSANNAMANNTNNALQLLIQLLQPRDNSTLSQNTFLRFQHTLSLSLLPSGDSRVQSATSWTPLTEEKENGYIFLSLTQTSDSLLWGTVGILLIPLDIVVSLPTSW